MLKWGVEIGPRTDDYEYVFHADFVVPLELPGGQWLTFRLPVKSPRV